MVNALKPIGFIFNSPIACAISAATEFCISRDLLCDWSFTDDNAITSIIFVWKIESDNGYALSASYK